MASPLRFGSHLAFDIVLATKLFRTLTTAAHTMASSTAQTLSPIEAAKRAAAFAAVNDYVKPEHKYIGIGSGSTVVYVVERFIELGAEANQHRWFVPTSFQATNLIKEGGLRLGDIEQIPALDVTIDGADEVDAAMNLIQGGGACHLREKVVAESAKDFIVVADYRKISQVLGDNWKKGVPIEVVPFAVTHVLTALKKLGSTDAKLRMAVAKAGPVVTDNGNLCIDAVFPQTLMRTPDVLLQQIKHLTGVVEVGIFTHICKAAYFGMEDGTITHQLPDGSMNKLEPQV